MIRNHPQSITRKLPTQRVTLYEAVPGASYSHHASVCYFDGYFYAMWSGGFVGEDEPGQRVLLCRSADGLHWSAPQVLVRPEQVTYPEGVLTAGGFHVHEGVLTAYFGHYAYIDAANPVATGDNYKDTFLGYMTTADGEHWSQPVRTAVPVVPQPSAPENLHRAADPQRQHRLPLQRRSHRPRRFHHGRRIRRRLCRQNAAG